jgi:hypothetical protein
MNIEIIATRDIQVIKTGKIDEQTMIFDAYQTPTNITYKIHDSEDPIQTYIDWVRSGAEDFEYPIYADDDFLNERDPVGYEIYNAEKRHIEDFLEWVQYATNEGYEIKFRVI